MGGDGKKGQPLTPAQRWTLCHCVPRHQAPVLNAQTGQLENFLPLPGKDHTGQPSWTRPAFPIISSLQLTFSLPHLQALTLSPILADTPLNSHIRKESGHYHAHASGFRSWVPHLMVM